MIDAVLVRRRGGFRSCTRMLTSNRHQIWDLIIFDQKFRVDLTRGSSECMIMIMCVWPGRAYFCLVYPVTRVVGLSSVLVVLTVWAPEPQTRKDEPF